MLEKSGLPSLASSRLRVGLQVPLNADLPPRRRCSPLSSACRRRLQAADEVGLPELLPSIRGMKKRALHSTLWPSPRSPNLGLQDSQTPFRSPLLLGLQDADPCLQDPPSESDTARMKIQVIMAEGDTTARMKSFVPAQSPGRRPPVIIPHDTTTFAVRSGRLLK